MSLAPSRETLVDGKIKVLIVDDNPRDAELSVMQLRRAGVLAETVVAANERELRAALGTFTPDVIVCDFSFPDFDGLAAQRIVRESHADTPLIFVSGAISEDRAVMALQSGAVDYVLKSNLLRLAPAVQRAVRDARDRKRLEVSLLGSEERARRQATRLEALWRIANNPSLSGHDLTMAMLREAAESMRPGRSYIGVLRHVDGRDYVLDAVSGDLGPPDGALRTLLAVGTRIGFAETIGTNTLVEGRTQSWEDIQALSHSTPRQRAIGWRGMISTLFVARGVRHELSLGSLDPPAGAPFGAEDHAYLEVLGSIFARHFEVEAMEGSLRAAEARSRQHAERLEALWQVANDPALRGHEQTLAMLCEAARSIRPGQRFRGVLGRIEGGDVVVIGVGVDPDDNDPRATLLKEGLRTSLDQTIIPRVGRSQAWDDISALNDIPPVQALLGWRAVLSSQFNSGLTRYSLTFASPEPATLPFGAEDFAYLDVLGASFANQLHVDQLQASLRDEEERARLHAERLEKLWNIVNSATLRDEQLWLAMLAEAAASIRSGQRYRGMLWRVDADEVIIEAVADSPGFIRADPAGAIGTRFPLGTTIIGKVLAEGGGTRSWDDIQNTEYAGPRMKARKTRSFAITTFKAGASTWGLSFSSDNPAATPFGSQEHAYIEVLASFFANHVQQRWQFDRIEYQQSHDNLTGLLNRSQFRSQARSAARTNSRYAVIVVDINAFREINESYGHMIGDALLVEVANALRNRASPNEIVGRIGGDVFGIFVPDPESTDVLRDRAFDFAGIFANGFSTGDREGTEFVSRTASLGVAVAPDDGTTIDTILARADAALFVAKERGHGSTVFYEGGMEGDAHRRAALRNELADAIASDQFALYYQPHVDLQTGAVSGCEALIRWNHPTRGLLLPAHFIPFAEQIGIITSIDDWVMRHAFAAANELAALRPGFRIYFNLSGRQAGDPKIVRAFVKAARSGVRLKNIGVEITETDAMRDVEATRQVCRALHRLNVRVAIDDFGTGYSSLSSLKRLPVDIVKIDRTFVSGVLSDPHDETIAETIIAIAERFGFDSLAEGAERPEEIEWFRNHACRFVQGYAVCHPLPLPEFKAWLSDRDTP